MFREAYNCTSLIALGVGLCRDNQTNELSRGVAQTHTINYSLHIHVINSAVTASLTRCVLVRSTATTPRPSYANALSGLFTTDKT